MGDIFCDSDTSGSQLSGGQFLRPEDGDIWQGNGHQCWGGGGRRARLLPEGDLLSPSEGEEVCRTGGGAAGTG